MTLCTDPLQNPQDQLLPAKPPKELGACLAAHWWSSLPSQRHPPLRGNQLRPAACVPGWDVGTRKPPVAEMAWMLDKAAGKRAICILRKKKTFQSYQIICSLAPRQFWRWKGVVLPAISFTSDCIEKGGHAVKTIENLSVWSPWYVFRVVYLGKSSWNVKRSSYAAVESAQERQLCWSIGMGIYMTFGYM